jgi:hypothetical protein
VEIHWLSWILLLPLVRLHELSSISRGVLRRRVDLLVQVDQILFPLIALLVFFEGDVHRLLLGRVRPLHRALLVHLLGVGSIRVPPIGEALY